MKNLRKVLILFLVVLVSGSTMAMETVRVNLVPGEREKAQVNILGAENQNILFELKNKNNEVVYLDHAKTPLFDFKKIYDFSKLENGEYTFEVTVNGKDEEFVNLMVNDGEVRITGREEQFAPSFKLDGKFLEFSFANPAGKNAQLLLYNNDTNDLVFQEALSPEPDIEQALNLARLDVGKYKAVVISGNLAYDYDFRIN